jgi:cupin fold WbuC family metalloprotein
MKQLTSSSSIVSDSIKFLDTSLLDTLTESAKASARLRMNHNLHPVNETGVQRLAIAMEPGTYVRPHRHNHSWEVLIALRGSFSIVVFNDEGEELNRFVLGASGVPVVEMPAGTWHSVASRENGSIIFEVKEGAYVPVSPADFAAWAPEDNTPEAKKFVGYVAAV